MPARLPLDSPLRNAANYATIAGDGAEIAHPPRLMDAIRAALDNRLFQWIAERRQEYRTRNSLNRLDDRMLRDIGITRGEISGIAHEAVKFRARTGRRASLEAVAPSRRPTQVIHL